MATSDETNVQQLPAFSSTAPFEQMAIILKAEGKSYDVITNTINEEYKLAYKQISVREWFWAGGRLEQAYNEYNNWHADQAVIQAKIKIKKISEKAANTLDVLMGDAFDGRTRQQAAKTVLGKYVPDRQVIIDESKADELPPAIGDAGDELISGDSNSGQDEMAQPPESEPAGQDAGPGSG